MGGILKEAILNKENEDNSDEHDETETFLKCLSKQVVLALWRLSMESSCRTCTDVFL